MVDVTKTRAQLKQRVFEKLGLSQAGQTISSEDATFIDGVLDAAVDQLNEDRIVYVADLEAIPVAIFEDLAVLIADRNLAKDYGVQMDTQQSVLAERRLRRMTAAKPTGQVLRAEYF